MKNGLFFAHLCFAFVLQARTTFDVDQFGGDDTRNGTSEATAFQSLKRINKLTCIPSDSIFFKRGGECIWTLEPKGNEVSKKPTFIGAYGKGSLPIIDAQGNKEERYYLSETIVLFNKENWETRDLEILNFDGIRVNKYHFLYVDRGGFSNQSSWRTRDMSSKFGEICVKGKTDNRFSSFNSIVENSEYKNIGASDLVIRVAESPLVQFNLFVKCSFKTTGNASYTYNCNYALWQFNEACYMVYNEGDIDASGFDSDYLCKNTIVQFNYSDYNDWGGLLLCSLGKT